MTNKELLKKKIIYSSTHRGSKEMDLLLGGFVKKHINLLKLDELNDLYQIINKNDEILYQWYFKKDDNVSIPKNKVSMELKKFKI